MDYVEWIGKPIILSLVGSISVIIIIGPTIAILSAYRQLFLLILEIRRNALHIQTHKTNSLKSIDCIQLNSTLSNIYASLFLYHTKVDNKQMLKNITSTYKYTTITDNSNWKEAQTRFSNSHKLLSKELTIARLSKYFFSFASTFKTINTFKLEINNHENAAHEEDSK